MLYFHSIGRLGRICQRGRGGAVFLRGEGAPSPFHREWRACPTAGGPFTNQPPLCKRERAGHLAGGGALRSPSSPPLPKGPICRAVAAPLPPFPALRRKETQPAQQCRWGSLLPPRRKRKTVHLPAGNDALPFSCPLFAPVQREKGICPPVQGGDAFSALSPPPAQGGEDGPIDNSGCFYLLFRPVWRRENAVSLRGQRFRSLCPCRGNDFPLQRAQFPLRPFLHTKKRNHLPVNKRPPLQPDFVPMWRNRRIFSGAEGNPLPTVPRIKRGKQSASGQHLPS